MEKKENNGMCLSVCAYAVSDLCMAVVDKETDDPITKFITEEFIQGRTFPPFCAFLDTNNHPGIEKTLQEAGIAEPYTLYGSPVRIQSGFCVYPLYQFDPDRLRSMDPEGTAEYEKNYKKRRDSREKGMDAPAGSKETGTNDAINPAPLPKPGKEYGGETVTTSFQGVNWDYYKGVIDDFKVEYENSDSLLMFQEWMSLEEFFGQRISLRAYYDLASYYNEDEDGVNGDILELQGDNPMIQAFRAGDSAFWKSSGLYADRGVVPCIIERLLTPYEAPLFIHGPIYRIRILTDGKEVNALYGELMTREQAAAAAD